jgi:hypothetical protein
VKTHMESFEDFQTRMYGPDDRRSGGLTLAMQQRGLDAGRIVLEQRFMRSNNRRECVECGNTEAVQEYDSILVKCVSSYFLCQDCHARYE